MLDDVAAWGRAGYPSVAIGRYNDAAYEIERLRKLVDGRSVEPSDGSIYQAGSPPIPVELRAAIDAQGQYPQIRKLFDMISADNGSCTADEIEALLATLSDDQLQVIAAGEQTEMDELKQQLQRDGPTGVADALWNLAAVAFDG